MRKGNFAFWTAVILMALVALTGCPKKEVPPPPPVEEEVVPPPPPPPKPEIQSFTHDATGDTKPGDTVNFKLKGVVPEGGSVVVDVPGTDAKATLSGSGGSYGGSMVVPDLKPGTYQLRARVLDENGNAVATMLADAPLKVVALKTACEIADERMGDVRAHFAFDRYDLDAEAKASIQSVADAIKKSGATGFDLVIEGHCDERGTIEYNLALGENRARATREYLVSLGVDGSGIRIVSYGEERPIDPASNEAAWAKNRRAEFVLNCD